MRKFFFIFLCIFAFVLSSRQLSALTVGPTSLDFSLDPGTSQDLSVTIFNDYSGRVTVRPTLFRISGADENGFPSFERIAPDDVLGQMISFPSGTAYVLAAQERKDVPLRVTVAKQQKPGGYYAVLSWGSDEAAEGVSLSGQPGVIIAISVRGEVEYGARIARFSSSGGSGVLMAGQPIVFEVDIENTSGVHISPVIALNIRNMFGKTVANIPFKAARVLPNTVRTFAAYWEPKWVLGGYSAVFDVNAGEAGIVTSSISFVVISTLALGALSSIVLIILVLVLLRILRAWK